MPLLRLLVLGPVRLLGADGDEVRGLGAKARGALAFLAADPARTCMRDRLASLLWDGETPRSAQRQMLLVLRRRLGPLADHVIRADTGTLALAPALHTDLAGFEAHLAAGRLEAACALWRGPFCEGLDAGGEGFEEWLALWRARLDDRAAAAFARLARAAAEAGCLDTAVAAARRRVAIHPLDEAAQAELIALYRRRGWTGAAATAHRHCVALFRRELGVAPGAEVQGAARTPVLPQPAPVSLPVSSPAAVRGPVWQRWRGRAAAAALILAAGLAWETRVVAPEAEAAPAAAWVDASEWRADARPDSGEVPLAEAIARGLAGDPEFAHLVPGGC
jgi:DNA-binding SARP family transcriptional activator